MKSEADAQAPGVGQIYFLRCNSPKPRIKIGWTKRMDARLEEVGTSCPYPVELLLQTPGSTAHEQVIHKIFSSLRRHGEWFEVADNLLGFIEILKRDGLPNPTFKSSGLSHLLGDPRRQELAALVRRCAEPCKAGELIRDQQRRVARELDLSFRHVWRMWYGRGDPRLLNHVKGRMGILATMVCGFLMGWFLVISLVATHQEGGWSDHVKFPKFPVSTGRSFQI